MKEPFEKESLSDFEKYKEEVKHLYLNPVKREREHSAFDTEDEINLQENPGYRLITDDLSKNKFTSFLEKCDQKDSDILEDKQYIDKFLLTINPQDAADFLTLYKIEHYAEIDEKDCFYKHIIELYKQDAVVENDVLESASFKKEIHAANKILIDSLLKVISLKESNYDELHQLMKDITAYEKESCQFIASSNNKSCDQTSEKESILQKGSALQKRIHDSFPTDKLYDKYAYLKGAMLSVVGVVVGFIGLFVMFVNPIVGAGLMATSVAAIACSVGFFAAEKPNVSYKPYNSDRAFNSMDVIVEATCKSINGG